VLIFPALALGLLGPTTSAAVPSQQEGPVTEGARVPAE
jgi:hypothetical protein